MLETKCPNWALGAEVTGISGQRCICTGSKTYRWSTVEIIGPCETVWTCKPPPQGSGLCMICGGGINSKCSKHLGSGTNFSWGSGAKTAMEGRIDRKFRRMHTVCSCCKWTLHHRTMSIKGNSHYNAGEVEAPRPESSTWVRSGGHWD